MEIVQLDLDDIEQVFELSNQLENYSLTFESFRSCFYEIVSLNNHLLYGIKMDKMDKIVGYIHLRLEKQLHHAGLVVEILELVIDDQYRSQRLGKRLLDFATSYSISIGACQLELTTNIDRNRTHQFYFREGFSQTSYKFVKNLRN